MILRPITKKYYKLLLDMDKKIYPTDHPVTGKILDNWFALNPEFGMIYEHEKTKKILGVCIVIPLNKKGWDLLINGKLAESDLDSNWIFDNKKDKEIGLHIYHIEKLDSSINDFYKICLKDLSLTTNRLKVIGFSGLCVTKEGINLFENKLNCKEKKFISKEYILEKAGVKKLILAENKDIRVPKDYILLNRCKMLISYPGEKSIIWNYF